MAELGRSDEVAEAVSRSVGRSPRRTYVARAHLDTRRLREDALPSFALVTRCLGLGAERRASQGQSLERFPVARRQHGVGEGGVRGFPTGGPRAECTVAPHMRAARCGHAPPLAQMVCRLVRSSIFGSAAGGDCEVWWHEWHQALRPPRILERMLCARLRHLEWYVLHGALACHLARMCL